MLFIPARLRFLEIVIFSSTDVDLLLTYAMLSRADPFGNVAEKFCLQDEQTYFSLFGRPVRSSFGRDPSKSGLMCIGSYRITPKAFHWNNPSAF